MKKFQSRMQPLTKTVHQIGLAKWFSNAISRPHQHHQPLKCIINKASSSTLLALAICLYRIAVTLRLTHPKAKVPSHFNNNQIHNVVYSIRVSYRCSLRKILKFWMTISKIILTKSKTQIRKLNKIK